MALIPASLAQVLQFVASLSNSSNWLSFNAGVSSGSPNLTALNSETPFQTTALDAGKSVVVRGAGAAGADLVTTILTVTNGGLAVMANNAGATIGSAPVALGGQYADDRHSYVEIFEAVMEADEQVVTAILETLGHWARPDYLVLTAAITNAAQIPSHVGKVAEILISNASGDPFLPGTIADLKAIQRWNANTGSGVFTVYGSTSPTTANSPLAGYYAIDADDYLFFTGFSAKARVYQFQRSATALQSPNVCQGTVGYGALRALELKDGENPIEGSAFGKFFQDGLSSVRMAGQ